MREWGYKHNALLLTIKMETAWCRERAGKKVFCMNVLISGAVFVKPPPMLTWPS